MGNVIGNIRVWNSCDNRSDGAKAPAHKLLYAQYYQQADFALWPDMAPVPAV